jgi:polyhydroxyalkanoate synthesis regulator phasin
MSDDKPNVSDKASEIAKNIWLAGLGAYGKALDEAQERLDKASKEPPRLFKDLVKKGEALEDEVRETVSTAQSKTSSVEERIRKVRENFNLNLNPRQEEIAELNDKVDALTAKVDAIAAALKVNPKKPAARKKPAPKKSVAPKKSAARKKPAAKKAAPKKAAKKRKS